ncbi:class I SAM-dependent methyltransferase [Chitinophaga niabensis]|uniref:Methyltransferase domain-containing protein n=1 Tax=Chitinophaga niabensis TaxID=536979 RepID=A0A1N6DYB8_9BACT|nr:class I SAM-dependent methyltransferase [Chitinophaga niabensis]SIN75779.1 Methyltransferase domain-containing protein [Chitinophaga niabensis]
MKINERFTWAVDVLNIKPSDHLLEIGCGAGILAEQIGGRLTAGTITAIDSSAAMIKIASRKNIANAHFITSDFASAALPGNAYHKILAFNVNFFWKDPATELALIRKYLKRNGKLYVFYQAPYDITITAAKPIEEKLRSQGYKIVDTIFKKLSPASAFCIVAT